MIFNLLSIQFFAMDEFVNQLSSINKAHIMKNLHSPTWAILIETKLCAHLHIDLEIILNSQSDPIKSRTLNHGGNCMYSRKPFHGYKCFQLY